MNTSQLASWVLLFFDPFLFFSLFYFIFSWGGIRQSIYNHRRGRGHKHRHGQGMALMARNGSIQSLSDIWFNFFLPYSVGSTSHWLSLITTSFNLRPSRVHSESFASSRTLPQTKARRFCSKAGCPHGCDYIPRRPRSSWYFWFVWLMEFV